MKRSLVWLALMAAGCTASCIFAQEGTSAAGKEVLAVEHARATALTQSDVAALDRIMADNATYVHASGKVDTKASYLGAIKSGQLHYLAFTPMKLNVRVLGDTAVVDGEYGVKAIDLRVQQTPLQLDIFILTVYAHRDGRWQQIAWQSTRDVAKTPAQ
jgi:ketosteroid isomerase-like protein